MTHPSTPQPSAATTLVSVGDVQEAGDRLYFLASFKRGLFGKPVHRTFWGQAQDDGTPKWERVSPQDLTSLLGRDLSSEVEVVACDIEPEEFTVDSTGEIRTIEARTIVRFNDETVAQACRKYGSRLKEQTQEATEGPVTPQTSATPMPGMPGHYVVGTNGQTAPLT